MEIRTSIFKRSARVKPTKAVDSDGNRIMAKAKSAWVYRIRYVDETGTARVQERSFATKTEARDSMREAEALIRKTGGHSRKSERLTFNRLADICEKEIYFEARYEGSSGQKISGVKSVAPVLSAMKHLRAFFGNMLVTSITPQLLRNYRDHRKAPTLTDDGKEIVAKITTINRELGIARRMFSHAVESHGLAANPFSKAKKLINVGLETRRKRVLSHDEEGRLLAACTGRLKRTYTRTRHGKEETIEMEIDLDHKHLRAAILLALDAGLRRNEVTSLRWSDVNFAEGYITIRAETAKDAETRFVPLTRRTAAALDAVKDISPKDRIFSIGDWKASFTTVREVAGIEDLWYRDLRRTFSHRLSHSMPLETVAQVMGHSDIQTTHGHYQARELGPILAVKTFLDDQHGINVLSETIN